VDYLPIMEYILQDHLFTFLVDNENDVLLMKKLIRDQYGDDKIPQSESQRRIRRPKVVNIGSVSPHQKV